MDKRSVGTGITGEQIWKKYLELKKRKPVVHCITNQVTVNDCANILLAAGALPTMAHHPLEVAEVTSGCDSLVCNMGAVSDFPAMITAGEKAKSLGHPVVLDPVGAASSSFRRQKCYEFIEAVHPDCIRGNYSEIKALIENEKTAAGVDADPNDTAGAEGNRKDCAREFMQYAAQTECLIAVSGKTDLVTDGKTAYEIANGDSMMTKITGAGCMSSVLIGAFLAGNNSLESVVSSCAFMGVCGEVAAEWTQRRAGGTMTFREQLIDRVFLMEQEELVQRAMVRMTEIKKREE